MDGPNCFNSVLVQKEMIDTYRHVTADEFDSYVNAMVCQQIKNVNEIEPSDIGVLTEFNSAGESLGSYHAVYFVDRNTVIQKDNIGYQSPIESISNYWKNSEYSSCFGSKSCEVYGSILKGQILRCSQKIVKLSDYPSITKFINDASLNGISSFCSNLDNREKGLSLYNISNINTKNHLELGSITSNLSILLDQLLSESETSCHCFKKTNELFNFYSNEYSKWLNAFDDDFKLRFGYMVNPDHININLVEKNEAYKIDLDIKRYMLATHYPNYVSFEKTIKTGSFENGYMGSEKDIQEWIQREVLRKQEFQNKLNCKD